MPHPPGHGPTWLVAGSICSSECVSLAYSFAAEKLVQLGLLLRPPPPPRAKGVVTNFIIEIETACQMGDIIKRL